MEYKKKEVLKKAPLESHIAMNRKF